MVLVIAQLLAAPAFAEDSAFAGTEAPPTEEKAEPVTALSAEFGTAFATGNAIFYTVAGTLKASHEWDRNKLSAAGGINLGAVGGGRLCGGGRGTSPERAGGS